MTLGPIIISISGEELTSNDREILGNDLIGGVILFTHNFRNKSQLLSLTKAIKAIKSPELMIFVDQEGGRIQRFKDGFFHLPSFRDLGAIYDFCPEKGIRSAHLSGYIMASELIEQGIDLSFSPVVDIDYDLSKVISDRSFHTDPEVVYKMADSYIRGMNNAGMHAVAKHFPGHGGVKADSHHHQPIDNRDYEQIKKDLKPYIKLIEDKLMGIMTAHILYPKVDQEITTFSKKWLIGILREKYSYQGYVFSDDLTMQSAAEIGTIEDRVYTALDAGCNFLLWCHPDETVLDVLKNLSDIKLDLSGSYKVIKPKSSAINHERFQKSITEIKKIQSETAVHLKPSF